MRKYFLGVALTEEFDYFSSCLRVTEYHDFGSPGSWV
jgi:hypothetical protein